MTVQQPLKDIASETNWITFAKKLRTAVKIREDYGFKDLDDILDRVAELRGQDRASLRNPVYAEKWLEKNAPDVHAAEPEHIAMTSVLKLILLERMSEVAVLEFAPKVFDGTATRLELNQKIEQAKRKTDQSVGVGHDRWHRKREYEDSIKRYLENNTGILGKGGKTVLRPRNRSKPVPCDFELLRSGMPIAAIEIKSHRQKITRKFQVETLAVASLLLREFPETYIIAPTSWERSMPSLIDLREQLSLQNVKFAIFDAEIANDHPEKALQIR
ncbi:hypothetical protein [Halocynthiibacter styelae]|uniref:Uncharacterized protein n=1 Tax=Halocynthiibacter styelae TaxID=2761955 RepID=A0A8J7J8E6_9RHOB|nr:hypothetical protein [Paenihalocynthiibacter styelae]MBI1495270.1 hypothetical protein [Paenihalocynthiibacter styelae]